MQIDLSQKLGLEASDVLGGGPVAVIGVVVVFLQAAGHFRPARSRTWRRRHAVAPAHKHVVGRAGCSQGECARARRVYMRGGWDYFKDEVDV